MILGFVCLVVLLLIWGAFVSSEPKAWKGTYSTRHSRRPPQKKYKPNIPKSSGFYSERVTERYSECSKKVNGKPGRKDYNPDIPDSSRYRS